MRLLVSLIVEIDATTDLATMEAQVQAAGHQAMRQALRQTVRQWEQEHRSCTRCGSDQVRQEGTVSRQIQALFGSVQLARQRLRCQHCFHRFCPANALLAPMAHGRVSPALVQAACMAGVSWPYEQAAQVLQRLSGAQICAEEIRLITNRQGQRLVTRKEQAPASNSPTPEHPHAKGQRTIIGLDGGWVPHREKRGGMEGKVAVVATDPVVLREPHHPTADMTWCELEEYLHRHRSPQVRRSGFLRRRYDATFASSQQIGQLATHAVEQLGVEKQEQVVIADGAAWIKKEAHRHFPHATCILDWPHLARTIAKAVRAVGLDRDADQGWVSRQIQILTAWLWKGEVEPVKAILVQWQTQRKAHLKIKAITAALTYLRTQQGWIGDYERWKRQGYPIGSGMVERAIALVINRRMKRQGMSWLRKNATAVVALRVALLNHEWPPSVFTSP